MRSQLHVTDADDLISGTPAEGLENAGSVSVEQWVDRSVIREEQRLRARNDERPDVPDRACTNDAGHRPEVPVEGTLNTIDRPIGNDGEPTTQSKSGGSA